MTSSVFEWRKPSGKVELLIISAFPQPCHRSAHRGSTWFLLSHCKDRKFICNFQIFSLKSCINTFFFVSLTLGQETFARKEKLIDIYFVFSSLIRNFAVWSKGLKKNTLGCKTFLCMRKLEDGNIFKPYAIIDEHTFNASISELRK